MNRGRSPSMSTAGRRSASRAALLIAVSTGCSGDEGVAGRALRADSAGIEIVASAGEDVPLPWTFEPVLRLGGADEGPESFSEVDISRFGTDDAGRLYVLDARAFRVVVFAPDGSVVRTMGREGEGPGELRFPIGMAVAPTGVVRVFDIGRGGLVSFDADGAPLDPLPFGHYTEPGIPRHFALADTLTIVAKTYRASDAPGRLSLRGWPISASDPDSVVYLEFPLEENPTADFGCMMLRIPRLLAPGLQWDVEGGLVAVSRMDRYRIDLFDLSGRPVRSVRRDLAPREATEADALAEAGPGMRMRGNVECEASAEEVVAERGYAERIPLVGSLLLSPSGELWVERFVPGSRHSGDPSPIDVFDETGAYLGTLPEGTPFPVGLLPDGRVALAERDPLDIVRLVIARVRRPSGEPLPGD